MKNKNYILGLNCYHADSSACLILNNEIVAAAEEERFKRIKHFAGFPVESIKFCLKHANIKFEDVKLICINTNPFSNLRQKIKYTFVKDGLNTIVNKINLKLKKNNQLYMDIKKNFIVKNMPKILFFNHHDCHHYSSYFSSNFKNAASLSIDGFGDFVSTSFGFFKNNNLKKFKEIYFPDSLGILYSSITQLLGFKNYGDEYKVMGLAAYGKPVYVNKIYKLINVDKKIKFSLNQKYFTHTNNKFNFVWNNTYPKIDNLYSPLLVKLFSLKKKINYKVKADIACSLQTVYEDILILMCQYLQKKTQTSNLVLSGGCAMNTLANGKILTKTNFKNIFIQPAAGDNGGALGAAFLGNLKKYNIRMKPFTNAYLGPSYKDQEILNEYENNKKKINMFTFDNFNKKFYDFISTELTKKKVIGWFQDEMEWGARALGNRSIIADPRNGNMRDIINKKIKFREKFRPFAPIVLEKYAKQWFENINVEPFMMKIYNVKKNKKKYIQSVVHKDNTSRVQTVNYKQNPKIFKLLQSFNAKTGVPILINTSLNENEPIINSPKEAFQLLLRTKLDYLIISKYVFKKKV